MSTSKTQWTVGGAIWKIGKFVTIASVLVPVAVLVLLLVISIFLPQSPPSKQDNAEKPKHVGKFQNVYQKGTRGFELAEFAKTVLPDTVTPYFVMAKDLNYFLNQTDPKVLRTVMTERTQEKMQDLPGVHPMVGAFTDYLLSTEEGASRSVCLIAFVNPKMAVVGSTLMHELMHCRIGSSELQPAFRSQIMIAATLVESVPGSQAYLSFEEILARAMSLSYIVNKGVLEDSDFFKTRLDQPYPANPGPKSMQRVIHLCLRKGACSTDPGQLARLLLDDKEFRDLLAKDYISNYAFNLATGYNKKREHKN